MNFTFKIEGVEGLIDRMSKFPPKLQDAAGRRSARRAMAVVRKAARDKVKTFDDPETKDAIWKNVYIQQSRRGSKRVGGVHMKVGILGGANVRGPSVSGTPGPGGDTRHWRFIELGTEDTPARPFLRPALEQNAQTIAQVLATELSKEIDKLANFVGPFRP